MQQSLVAAKNAFRTFSQTTKAERIKWLEKIYSVLKRREQDLINVMVEEYGGTSSFVEMIIPASINDFKEMANVLKDFNFEPSAGQSKVHLQCIGVVGVIIPWNMSNGFICTKIASAIGAGCTLVIKPSELSGQQTQIMMECIAEVGLPKGVVNFVNGTGDVVGAEMTRHPDINKIAFTGSTKVGKMIAKNAVDTMKRVTLELGGKSPNIILDDADFAEAIPKAIFAAFLNSGQACAAATRLLVPENRLTETNMIAKEIIEQAICVGDPKDHSVNIGPMVSKQQFDRIEEYIRIGMAGGFDIIKLYF